ncbi:cation transporter [Oceanibaculum pacificum]|uniref:Cation efflux protein transmembrane domain-containing protein n=1 Tax=Oceanibaculum pacificum TaxID=580166 RepID=A0A154VVU2_9PROT|nr:cation transporter [Oceanibaculum pacificum]KZD05328.1 hypothetical protein AUP43_11700 [Oceanibaculum pacificum]
MIPVDPVEFPAAQEEAFRKARQLGWLTVLYIASAAGLTYLLMGASQAMRANWLEDTVSIVPAIAFLIASRVARRRPTPHFPYGMHGAVSIGYLTAALALLAMGGFLLIESTVKLVALEKTSIGGFDLFGHTVWAGWPMLAALLYSSVPAFFLGRAKLKLAPKIHDKVLYADAEMNRADWMTALASAVGVIGVGLGYWWADGAAAIIVSLDVLRDGMRNTRAAVTDLISEMPKSTDDPDRMNPLPQQIKTLLESETWIERAEVRLREEGHVFFGEAFIAIGATADLPQRLVRLVDAAKALNWRLHDLTIMPVDGETLRRGMDRPDG